MTYPQVDIRSYQLTFFCEQKFWPKIDTLLSLKVIIIIIFADREYWFSAGTLWKVTGFPTETSSLVALHVDGNLRARQAYGKTEPIHKNQM